MLAVCLLVFAAPVANAATVVVDDDKAQCPNASETDLNDAVTGADPGDELALCAGAYEVLDGDNGLVIDKELTIRGAGADKVRIEPQTDIGLAPGVDRTVGNIVLVRGPLGAVDISGVTITSGGRYAEAGVVFRDVDGSLRRSRVTDLAGPRMPAFDEGQGLAVYADAAGSGHELAVTETLLEGYGKGGIAVRSEVADFPATIEDNVIRGRGQLSGAGQGQNGVQVRGAGARAEIHRNLIAEHRFTLDESASVGVLLYDTDGSRSSVTDNDFQNNGYGVFNAQLNLCDAEEAVPATSNWWGSPAGPTVDTSSSPPNCPPAVYAPTGPPAMGDRVNGINGEAVTFDPFRTEQRGAPIAPAAQPDAPPAITSMSPTDGAVAPADSAVTITADASDDFDVASVEFLRGGTVVATDTTPSGPARTYSASVPSPGPGSSQAITARATDSSGRTASRSIAIQGEALPSPAAPQQQQQVPEDRPPSITITAPGDGATINPSAAPPITAQADDDQGVARVGFLDDGKLVCSDNTAPYECPYTPAGDDVGRNTLIAIAVDGSGQTAVDFRAVSVGRFIPKLTAKTTPRRDRKRPYRYTTSGVLTLPGGVTPAEACASGGTVAIDITAGKLKLPTTATLRSDCTYRTSIAFPSRRSLGRGRLTVRTSFPGNNVVGAARARTQTVRAG